MKQILYITPYYKPAWFYGGPPKCIAEQAEYLAKHFNCKIDVVTLNKNGTETLFDSEEPVVNILEGVAVHYLPASKSKLGKAYFSSPSLKKYLEQFKAYDLIHVHMLFNAFSTAGASFAIKHHIPFGYSVHGMLDKFSLTRSKWMKLVHRFFYEDQQLLMAKFVHFTTDNERKNAVISRRAKAAVIPLGIVFEPFVEYQKPHSYFDLRMVYLGRVNRKKGLDLLLKAMAQLPENIKERVVLDIFGEDDDNFMPELKAFIQENKLQELVQFKGKLNPIERNKELQSYDLLVLTSHQENFGLVVAEALDQKIPVLISDKVNLCDEVENYKCGWVTSLSVTVIAKKIEEAFLTPKHIRVQMGARGHGYVRNSYLFEKVAENYWELYSNCFK